VPALQQVFGVQNMRWFFPLKSVLDAGIVVAGGSDHMIGHDKNNSVNPYNPFFNIWMCVSRQLRGGGTFYPEERVSREAALRMYTTGAAWLQFDERTRGTLEPGKLGDAVVIDHDFFTCPEAEIRSIEPILTIAGGHITYRRQ
jgi:predicted amidohydrolase YtcJ